MHQSDTADPANVRPGESTEEYFARRDGEAVGHRVVHLETGEVGVVVRADVARGRYDVEHDDGVRTDVIACHYIELCDHQGTERVFRPATGYLLDHDDEWLCVGCGAAVPAPEPMDGQGS